MKDNTLGGRLLSVAGFVRQGAVFADVGTDHAHLPIFLLEHGRIKRAVCSDINKGPLALAMANVAEAGVTDKVDFVLTDGAYALAQYHATDYAICGMGGELIADIIDKAPHLKNTDVRLLLQPMSKQAHLRTYLGENGFTVTDEIYSTDEGKHYVCLVCRYTGSVGKMSYIDAEIGLKTIKNVNISSQISYFKTKQSAVRKKIRGLEKGTLDTEGEQKLLAAIDERLKRLSLIEESGEDSK